MLLCLVPTTAVLGWGIVRKMPSHLHEQEQQLSDVLGLQAALMSVTHPRPGAVLYEGLRLTDPESGEVVLRCRLLEVERRGGVMTITASQPEIDAAHADCLQRLLARWQRREFAGESNIQLQSRELVWRVSSPQVRETAVTLTGVQGSLQQTAAAAEVVLSFLLAEQRNNEPVEIRLTRSRQSNPPTSEFSLKTGEMAVPCMLFNPLVDSPGVLGNESRFRGAIRAKETSAGWSGDLEGIFSDVDLQPLVSERFPHQLTGKADITIERAAFQDGRLTEAALELVAGPGVISRSLLLAAVESLHMEAKETFSPRSPLVDYQQLIFQARFDADGLQISGQADPRFPRAVIFDTQRVLLFAPEMKSLPVTALVRMLVPSNEVQVPASRETQWLIEHLPVPQVMRPKNADGTAPRPTARPRFGGPLTDERN